MTSTPVGDEVPQHLIDLAAADLATRLGVDRSAISVVSARAVTWPDGSLGCPQPGVAYTQVLVDGTRIDLAVGAKTYSYHSGGRRQPFLCENSK